MSTLRAEFLAKSYKGRQVVKNVGLSIEAGSIVGLLGPNGAGKTTTFYMIVGLVPSDKGTIHIDDQDITLLPMHSRAAIRYWLFTTRIVYLSKTDRLSKFDGDP